jgi:hypothetical protein
VVGLLLYKTNKKGLLKAYDAVGELLKSVSLALESHILN